MSGAQAPAVDPAAPAAAAAPTAPIAPVAAAAPAAAPGVDPAPPKVGGNVLGDALAPAPAEGTQPAEPARIEEPAAEIRPESYLETLKLPDTIAKDDPLLTAFLAGAAKGGMDGESVQAVVDEMAPQIRTALAAPYEAWKTLQETWQNEVKTDPELGGDKTLGVISTVNRALALVGGTDLAAIKAALDVTGAGNNPAIIRAMYRLSKGLVEAAGPVTGTPADPKPAKDPARLLYPSTVKAE